MARRPARASSVRTPESELGEGAPLEKRASTFTGAANAGDAIAKSTIEATMDFEYMAGKKLRAFERGSW
jgi:hypothetical protein